MFMKRFNFLTKYLCLILIVFTYFMPLFGVIEVKADTISNISGVVDGVLSIDIGETKNIIPTEQGVVINSCWSSSSGVKVNFDYMTNTCEVTALNYGMSILNLTTSNNEDISIYIDAKTSEYLDIIADKLPEEVYVIDEYHMYYNSSYTNISVNKGECNKNGNIYTCDMTINYYYQKINESDKDFIKNKQMKFIIGNEEKLEYTGWTNSLYVNGTLSLSLNRTSYKNLVFVSSDTSIATVDSSGLVTGISDGEVVITVYDIEANEQLNISLTVLATSDITIEEYKASLAQGITLDIANNYSEYSDLTENIKSKIRYDLGQLFRNKYWINGNIDVSCEEYNCSIYFTYSSNNYGGTIDLTNIPVTINGINIDWVNQQYVGDQFELNITNLTGKTVTYEYDHEYLSFDNNQFTALKSGKTTVKAVSSKYSDEIEINILPERTIDDQFNQYKYNLDTLVLSYKDQLYSNTQLAYLEQIIANKIIYNMPSDLKGLVEVKVRCLTGYVCEYDLSYIGNFDSYRGLKINYLNEDDQTIDEINRIITTYGNNLKVDITDSLALKNECSSDECVINKILTNNYNIQSDLLNISFESKKLNSNNGVKDSVEFDLVIKDSDMELYRKSIKVNFNLIINMGIGNKTAEEKEAYIKNMIDELFTVDSVVSRVRDDIFNISYNSNNYNVIAMQQAKVYPSGISTNEGVIELSVGDIYQPHYRVYPLNANDYEVKIISRDKNIVDVVDGSLVAKGVGYTYIDLSVETKTGFTMTTILVTVDYDINEYLNTVLNAISTDINITYDLYQHNSIENAISNSIFQQLYANGYSFLGVYVDSDNENYSFKLCLANGGNICTENKNINYKLVGISISKTSYYIDNNETIDTELKFTEGSNTNLKYFVQDTEIVEYDTDGKLKALKPGSTVIFINDVYYQYSNYFKVFVDYDTYKEELITEIKKQPVLVDASLFSQDDTYSLGFAFSNALYKKISYDMLNPNNYGAEYVCNTETKKCDVILTNYNGSYNEIMDKYTFDYEIVGIGLSEQEIAININDTYTPNYTLYTNDNVKIESLNEEVCTVSNNTITGIKTGVCFIKYTLENSGYTNYITVSVNEDNIASMYDSAFNSLPNQIDFKMVDISYLVNSDEVGTFYDYISFKINKDYSTDDYYIDAYLDDNFEFDYSLSISHDLYDQNSGYSTYKTYTSPTTKHGTINKIIASDEITNEGRKILDDIEDSYSLTLEQYLKYQMYGENAEFYKFSSMIDLFEEYGSDYSFEFSARYGCDDPDNKVEGGMLFVFYKDYLVGIKDVEFKMNIKVLVNGEITEEKMIENLKTQVKEEYIKMKNSSDLPPILFRMFPLLSINPLAIEDDIEVNVTKEFDPQVLNYVYTVTVEDLSFKTILSVNSTDKITYDNKEENNGPSNPQTPTETIKIGDLNLDNKINMADLIILRKYLAGLQTLNSSALKNADLNKDNKVNMTDLIKMRKYLAGLENL